MTHPLSWTKQQLKDEIVYITTDAELRQATRSLTEAELALDSETYLESEWAGLGGNETAAYKNQALDPHTSRVSVISLKTRNSLPHVLDIVELERAGWDPRVLIDFLLSKTRILAYNATFDLKMLRKELGVVLENFWCIRVLVKLIQNAFGSKFGKRCGASLDDAIRDFLRTPERPVKIEGKGREQVSNWLVRPKDTDGARNFWVPKVRYAAEDIDYLFELADLLEPVLVNPLPKTPLYREGKRGLTQDQIGLGMSEVLQLEQEAQVAIAEMEWNGLPVAPEMTDRFYDHLKKPKSVEGRLNELAAELYRKLGMESKLEEPPPPLEHPVPKEHNSLRNPLTLKQSLSKATGLELPSSQTKVLERLLELYQELDQVQKGEKEDIDWANEDEEELFIELYQFEQGQVRESSDLIDKIILYKQLDKVYGMDLRQYINPKTGRIHASYDSCGASTSRTSSSSPNAQQVNGGTELTIWLPKDQPIDQQEDHLWLSGFTNLIFPNAN